MLKYSREPYWLKCFSVISIVFLGILVYSNTFTVPFQFDDIGYIVNNPSIRNIHHFINIWRYYPCRFLTFLTIAVNYYFCRLNVFGYHFINLAIHLFSAILVWWLILLTFSTPHMKGEKITNQGSVIALFAALVFVCHPLQIEAVTYIWQRTASMAAFFYLASVCFYVKSRLDTIYGEQEGDKVAYKIKLYYICSLLFAIMAMFTKEMTITLPLMILLYEIFFLKNRQSLNWQYLIPFFLTLLIIPVTIIALPNSLKAHELQGVLAGLDVLSPQHYFLTQFRVMLTYIRLAFLPLSQNLDYDYPVYKSILELPVLGSVLFLTVILWFAKRLFLRYRLLSFSIFWFFLILLPESSVVPLADVIFEHRLYLPLVGFSIFLVSGIFYISEKRSFKMILVMLMIIVAGYAVLAYQRNNIWRDGLTLWNDTVQKSPYKARPYNNRGLVYNNLGQLTKALEDFNSAIAIDPDYKKAYYNRGLVFSEQARFSEALLNYNKSLELDPKYEKAYYNRGLTFIQQGQYAHAVFDLKQVIKLDPENAEAYENLANACYRIGKYRDAWLYVHKAEDLGAVIDQQLIKELLKAFKVTTQDMKYIK